MPSESNLLRNHFNANENSLISISKIPANSGHPLHKGTPREVFIKEFLAKHISETVAIGSGEIIHYNSKPNDMRNQFDIVVYRRDYPKLDFGGGINAFLADSVVATVEVKSTLDKSGLLNAAKAARRIKSLHTVTHFEQYRSSHFPPCILNYLVAYDGPTDLRTVYNWLEEFHLSEGFSSSEKLKISPSLDTIVVLGKGFVHFDNMPVRFLGEQIREEYPDVKWAISNSPDENVLLLFFSLTWAIVGGKLSNELSILNYMTDVFSAKQIYYAS